ncbi:hypothetical protein HK105_206770 [Polyrhizophydium stewartii]|uniref:Ankyrin repeat protein n=1 Tax=Polyrhizophydium stewartii TaxID=2732419 RepID=A0ABR4N2M9_9FUNG
MADIRTNDAPAAALAAPPPAAQPAAAHADPAAATAQHDRLAERLDGQPAPPPAVSPPLAAAPASTTSQPPPSTTSDAPRAVRFRPDATNEWDRMPAEIHSMILEHAGVLTLWVNGRIDDAKLSFEQFKEMLSDVFELDWQGDLATLPFESFAHCRQSKPFLHIHTRSMHTRVKALGFDNLESGLEQAAILNGWTDLLDFRRAWRIGYNAASCGNIELLQHLVDERKIVALEKEHVRLAALFNHIDVLKWLADRLPNRAFATDAMAMAASHGDLDVVKFMHANSSKSWTKSAMNDAARGGRLDVVKFLHANRTKGCTTNAMNDAARDGHLPVVK